MREARGTEGGDREVGGGIEHEDGQGVRWGGGLRDWGLLSLLKLDERKSPCVGTEEPAGGNTGRFLCSSLDWWWCGEGGSPREAVLPHSPLCSGASGLLMKARPPQLVAHVHPEGCQLPSLLLRLAPLPLK